MAKTVGDRIRKMRLAVGMTQDQLARDAKLAAAVSISRYERNETEPSTATIRRLAKVLRCAPEWLAWGES